MLLGINFLAYLWPVIGFAGAALGLAVWFYRTRYKSLKKEYASLKAAHEENLVVHEDLVTKYTKLIEVTKRAGQRDLDNRSRSEQRQQQATEARRTTPPPTNLNTVSEQLSDTLNNILRRGKAE